VTDHAGHGGLTDFQVDVARLFFALPESEGFLLAGGAALVAQALTDRPTQTSTSSPVLAVGMSSAHGTRSRRPLKTGVGLSSG
jgi:hypothetical protein